MSRNATQMSADHITFSDCMTNIILYLISILISCLSDNLNEDSNEMGKIKAFNFSDTVM